MKNQDPPAAGPAPMVDRTLPPDTLRRKRLRTLALCASMIVAIWIVAMLAYDDVKRRSAESLEDFASDQTTLAQCLAANLREQPELRRPIAQGAWTQWTTELRNVEKEGVRLLLFQPPGVPWFLNTRGQQVESAPLREALAQRRTSVRLPRPEAHRLGLPERMAMAGLAGSADGAAWRVAVVATARRERDREEQESWRTLLAVLISAGAVLTFGGIALHWQGQELRAQRALELEEAHRQHEERLERAGRAATLGTLAMGITHELSTPLGIIAARAEQLKLRLDKESDREPDDRAARCVAAIQEQAERMSQVIRGMLGLVRGQNPVAVPLLPQDLARAAAALVEHRFEQSHVQLSLDIPAHLPRVLGDKRLLEHAVINLLLNARDACAPDGHVVLHVLAEGSLVVFSVVDDGPGISLEDAKRAMEPFFTTKPVGEGAGLGLAIAHEIIKSHHGQLHLTPRPEGGTCAAITVPRISEEEYALASPPPNPGG